MAGAAGLFTDAQPFSHMLRLRLRRGARAMDETRRAE